MRTPQERSRKCIACSLPKIINTFHEALEKEQKSIEAKVLKLQTDYGQDIEKLKEILEKERGNNNLKGDDPSSPNNSSSKTTTGELTDGGSTTAGGTTTDGNTSLGNANLAANLKDKDGRAIDSIEGLLAKDRRKREIDMRYQPQTDAIAKAKKKLMKREVKNCY
jgi:hypothetical protein